MKPLEATITDTTTYKSYSATIHEGRIIHCDLQELVAKMVKNIDKKFNVKIHDERN
jgi:hypothetical protein